MTGWCRRLGVVLVVVAVCLALASVALGAWLTADYQDGCATGTSHSANALAYARGHGANALRVVVGGQDMIYNDGSWHGSWANVRACFQAARAAGYHTYLALQWDRAIGRNASPSQVRRFVGGAMAQVGRWTNWIAVGNEPDLAGISPSVYRRAWTAAATYLATWWPRKWRVFGEAATTWWLRAAWIATASRPWRANALSIHGYDYSGTLWALPRVAQWVARAGRQLYSSEMAPDTYAVIGRGETLAQYESWVGWLRRNVRNLTMTSWYYWTAINPGY